MQQVLTRYMVCVAAALLGCLATVGAAQEVSPAERLRVTEFERLALPLAVGRAVAPPANLSLSLATADGPKSLHLVRRSVRTATFSASAYGRDGRPSPVAAPPVATYRGTVAEEPGVVVAGSLGPDGLTAGAYERGEMVWRLQPLAEVDAAARAGDHAFFKADRILPGAEVCGTDDALATAGDAPASTERNEATAPRGAPGVADCLSVCELAFDADAEFYALNGSSAPATIADIEMIVNEIDVIYAAQTLIRYEISDIVVRTDADTDPYTSVAHDTLLDEFETEWMTNQTSVARDTAHLMTGKEINGGTIGFAAVGAICSLSRGYGLSQSRFSSSVGLRVALTAHEIGHNWNARHCDADADCAIMCSFINGCTHTTTRFGARALAAILAFRDSRSCLSAGAGIDGTPLAPVAFNDSAAATGSAPVDIDVLANDADGNCDLLSIAAFDATSASGGSVQMVIDPTDGPVLRYRAAAGFSGDDTFGYAAADAGAQDSATVTVAVESTCVYEVDPPAVNFNVGTGAVTIEVLVADGCAWTATEDASWVTFLDGTGAGTGAGSFRYQVAANDGPARQTIIDVEGTPHMVSQNNGCVYELAAMSEGFDSGGGTGSVELTCGAGCVWTAVPSAGWVTITSATSGSGAATIDYSVAANGGVGRAATIDVGGEVFTITQAPGFSSVMVVGWQAGR